jgi:hypothetical protein
VLLAGPAAGWKVMVSSSATHHLLHSSSPSQQHTTPAPHCAHWIGHTTHHHTAAGAASSMHPSTRTFLHQALLPPCSTPLLLVWAPPQQLAALLHAATHMLACCLMATHGYMPCCLLQHTTVACCPAATHRHMPCCVHYCATCCTASCWLGALPSPPPRLFSRLTSASTRQQQGDKAMVVWAWCATGWACCCVKGGDAVATNSSLTQQQAQPAAHHPSPHSPVLEQVPTGAAISAVATASEQQTTALCCRCQSPLCVGNRCPCARGTPAPAPSRRRQTMPWLGVVCVLLAGPAAGHKVIMSSTANGSVQADDSITIYTAAALARSTPPPTHTVPIIGYCGHPPGPAATACCCC